MEAYLIATACTKFEKKADQTFKSLTEEVYRDLLKSAKVENGNMIGQAWFGNCGMGTFGQNNICLLYTSPSPRDAHESRMPSSA